MQLPSERPNQRGRPRERRNDANAVWPTLPMPRLDALRRLGDAEQRHAPGWLVRSPATATMLNCCA